jgi:hypothetical protein
VRSAPPSASAGTSSTAAVIPTTTAPRVTLEHDHAAGRSAAPCRSGAPVRH